MSRFRLLSLAGLALAACSSPTPPNPPPAPPGVAAALQKAGGDGQTTSSGQAVPVPPAVKVVDAAGQPVAHVQVSFVVTKGGGTLAGAAPTSGTDGIARVSAWILGDAGENSVTASTSGVTPQVFSASATPGVFHPLGNVSLSGARSYSDVVIPAGVTVTLLGDAIIKAKDFTLAGSVVGECFALSVIAEGKLTLGGTVKNDCSGGIPAAGAPGLRLVGLGGYRVDHGKVTTSGAFELTNDTTLTDDSFGSALRASGASSHIDTGVPCEFVQGDFTAAPDRETSGTPGGQKGDSGRSGHPWAASCRGDLIVTGPLNVTGQGGGDGGLARDNAPSAKAEGGKGGKGGLLSLRATEDLVFETGSSTTLTSGRGGDGGRAEATANAPSGNAKATGGAGNQPGLIVVRAGGTLAINAPVTLNIGIGGDGGIASAMAANAPPGCPVVAGGDATATGGAGGGTPDKQLRGRNVTGLASVRVTGGNAGRGGNGTGSAGTGGAGNKGCINGGQGGGQVVNGGNGGDAQLKDQNGIHIAPGGVGGDATFQHGSGGDGYNGCSDTPTTQGGPGGPGGLPQGNSGLGGDGFAGHAAPGEIWINQVGNGGKGGDGNAPGAGGVASLSGIGANGPKHTFPKSFQNGDAGKPCPKLELKVAPESHTTPINEQTSGVVTITITRTNADVPVTITPGPLPAGIQLTPTSITLAAGQNTAAFSATFKLTQAGDVSVPFAATATVDGKPISASGSLVVHVTAGDRYGVNLQKDTNLGNDSKNIASLFGMEQNHQLVILRETLGSTPKITITGLVVCGVPVTLVNSGSSAWGPEGNFSATGLITVNLGANGSQPIAVDIQGFILPNGTISFLVIVNPRATATFQFGSVRWVGSGNKLP